MDCKLSSKTVARIIDAARRNQTLTMGRYTYKIVCGWQIARALTADKDREWIGMDGNRHGAWTVVATIH